MITLWLTVAWAGETFQGETFFLGELHSHTGASGDAGSSDLGECDVDCGAVADLGIAARGAGLDFMAVTDHVNGPATATPQAFAQVWSLLLGVHDPDSGLVTIPGAEVWLRWPDGTAIGHKDVLFFDDDTALLQTVRMVDTQPSGDDSLTVADCDDLWTWMADLEARFGAALLLPHHPALSIPMETDWSCHSETWSPAVEVYSAHGSSLRHPSEWDEPWSAAVAASTVEAALDLGLGLGFVGGTDAHDTRPGSVCDLDGEAPDHPYGGSLTVVVLPEGETLTRSAVHQAILDKRTYTTSGPLVPVTVDWQVDGVSAGGHGAAPQVPDGSVLNLVLTLPTEWDTQVSSVRARGPGAWWDLVPDGAGHHTLTLPAAELPGWLYVDVTLDGEQPPDCHDGGSDTLEHLWLSPIRPQVVPAETGADSGTLTDSAPADSAPADSAPADSAPADSGEAPTGRCSGCASAPADGGVLLGLCVLGGLLRRRR
jgi:hypothetical protein